MCSMDYNRFFGLIMHWDNQAVDMPNQLCCLHRVYNNNNNNSHNNYLHRQIPSRNLGIFLDIPQNHLIIEVSHILKHNSMNEDSI